MELRVQNSLVQFFGKVLFINTQETHCWNPLAMIFQENHCGATVLAVGKAGLLIGFHR